MQETKETQVWSPGQEDSLEEKKATQSSILGKIPWTEEPGGLQSIECKELDTTEVNFAYTRIFYINLNVQETDPLVCFSM